MPIASISLPQILKYFLCTGVVVLFSLSIAHALDTISQNITPQSATTSGGNGNTVWFSTGTTATGTQYYVQYVNRDNDSSTVNNYLAGYYYDTQFGFFRLDWDASTPFNNVHIIDSTDRCTTGYGYKLGGFARGEDAGFLDFNYDNSTFVYYCESDQKLHGYAYNLDLGLQSFEGISFNISATGTGIASLSTGTDPFFVNNNSILLLPNIEQTSVEGDISSSDWGKSAIFYIIK